MRVLLILLLSVSASAFERLPFKCIEFNISIDREAIKRSGLSVSKVIGAVKKAAREWSKVSGKTIKIVKTGNIVIVPFSHHRFFGIFVPVELSGGVVSQAEIRLNCLKLSDRNLINATVLHELGHALGLAHSEFESATMFPLITEETNGLSIDDILGVK